MPAKSPEAIERRRARRMEKDRAKAAAKRALAKPLLAISALTNLSSAVSFRASDRDIAAMSKSELREMLAQAVRNTVTG